MWVDGIQFQCFTVNVHIALVSFFLTSAVNRANRYSSSTRCVGYAYGIIGSAAVFLLIDGIALVACFVEGFISIPLPYHGFCNAKVFS